jgi:DNA-binding CsgD family transcriptional regulator
MPNPHTNIAVSALTVRERQVLARVAAARTSKQIAVELGIALKTVNSHRQNIAQKLGTSSVADFTRYALANAIDVD